MFHNMPPYFLWFGVLLKCAEHRPKINIKHQLMCMTVNKQNTCDTNTHYVSSSGSRPSPFNWNKHSLPLKRQDTSHCRAPTRLLSCRQLHSSCLPLSSLTSQWLFVCLCLSTGASFTTVNHSQRLTEWGQMKT